MIRQGVNKFINFEAKKFYSQTNKSSTQTLNHPKKKRSIISKILKVSTAGILLTFTYLKVNNSTEIITSKENSKYLNEIKNMSYSVPFFCSLFYQQVIISEKLKGRKCPNRIKYTRELIDTPDGGKISIDYHVKDLHDTPNRLILVMHGLTGGSESSYIKDIMEGLENCKHSRLACVNYRGINNTPLLNANTYHAGYTDDLEYVIHYIADKHPNEDLYLVGTSMGANIITKLLSKRNMQKNAIKNDLTGLYKELPQIKGFVSISNPLDIIELERINRNGILDWYLLKRWKNYVKQHYDTLKQDKRLNLDKILSDDIKTYREFDAEYTCKVFNFKDADDYYMSTQSKNDLSKINVPTLLINSLDDQLAPLRNIDFSICKI